jgi:glycogen operon protein
LTVTLLSLGVPMILMGDEARRTQRGNNNAYCRDDETNWLDWKLLEQHADVHRFVTLLNARRLLRDVEHERERLSLNQMIQQANKAWHGVKLNQPDWGHHSHALAFGLEHVAEMGAQYLAVWSYELATMALISSENPRRVWDTVATLRGPSMAQKVSPPVRKPRPNPSVSRQPRR